jgi:gliding motility-associated protein GldE
LDTEPPALLAVSLPLFLLMSSGMTFSIFFLIVLIICSALISGSEVAFFSLGPIQIKDLEDDEAKNSQRILNLLEKPRRLLATILIGNNFVNIAIVVVSDFVIRSLLGNELLSEIGIWVHDIVHIASPEFWANFVNFTITVIGVTFILVLFGEVAPKIYANTDNLKVAKFMSGPLVVMNGLFGPFSGILVNWSNRIERRFNSNTYQNNSLKEDLDKAIDLTVSDSINAGQEAEILKGIVKFGDVRVKQIMKSRVDVVALDESSDFDEIMTIVKENGYSRLPVYKEDFDNIVGILYVKDLLGHTSEGKTFKWQKLVRDTVLYVPESKKIDDLLREFQLKRMHLAIVVDEYGGSGGIITLEDIMEEVIGDIKDEFDEGEDVDYVKLANNSYIFEGKTLLNDVIKIASLDNDVFNEYKGEADSLAGLVIEITGILPKVEKEIKLDKVTLKIVSTTLRRIERISLIVNED